LSINYNRKTLKSKTAGMIPSIAHKKKMTPLRGNPEPCDITSGPIKGLTKMGD
jgi:hypothetical protein